MISPALNPPLEFLATTFPIVFADVASTDQFVVALPLKSLPAI